jgi:hypothetical protein
MNKPIVNMAASVHQRLLNKAQKSKRPFNELLHYYAMERFLYRLSRSKYSEKFILKGALLFTAWEVAESRATMDIDLLGKMKNEPGSIAQVVKEICGHDDDHNDGLRFDPATVKATRIVEGADYHGVRVMFLAKLANARIPMQIDIGFGDPHSGGSVSLVYPTLLDHPAPHLKGYRPENAIAEKFEAMCKRGMTNTRMKDFFDVWLLARRFDFDGSALSKAIMETFASRHVEVPMEPTAFGSGFSRDKVKNVQWKAFLKKSRAPHAPMNLAVAVKVIKGFLGPIAKTLAEKKNFVGKWKAPGPWKIPSGRQKH